MQGEIELNLVNEYSIVKIASKPNLPYLFKFSEIYRCIILRVSFIFIEDLSNKWKKLALKEASSICYQ